MRILDEELDSRGQFGILQDLQGQPVPHGKRAAIAGERDTLIMRPREFKVDGHDVFSWSVGQIIGPKIRAIYDQNADKLKFEEVADGSVRYSDFIALPKFGVLAVDDRSSELHLGGRQAINRLQSVIDLVDDAKIDAVFYASPQEVRNALENWSLTKFKFTIRPNNPRPVSRLAEEMSELLKKEGIAQLTGSAKPMPGGHMQMKGNGFITAANDLTEAGYGQISVAGLTEDGLEAEIKKPRFDLDREKNEKIQEKPRELRISIDDEMPEDEIFKTAARALMKIYMVN
ncbi:MAG: hypothetical protein E6Q98_01060 [Rhodospirillaceae bacterium]|nr:MAG: hypothetical protein E6Q98_01060 [Rhodospirillaceae bacterium]